MTLAKNYAQALYQATENKSEKDQENIFQNFLDLLEKFKHTTLLPKILKYFQSITTLRQKSGVSLIVADEKDSEKYIAQTDKYFENQSPVVKVSPSIVGGFILKNRDTIIDGSYKKSLLNLYNNIIK